MTYDPQAHSGAALGFPYVEIQARIPEPLLAAHARSVRKRYDRLARRWNDRRNAEWMIRLYLAARGMVRATVALTASRDPTGKERADAATRLRRAERVRAGLIDAGRAYAMLLPDLEWEDGALARLDPERVVREVTDSLAEAMVEQGRWMVAVTASADAVCEYLRSRAEGYQWVGDVPRLPLEESMAAARLMGEMVQWHSEILADSLHRHADPPIGWDFSLLGHAASPTADGGAVLDEADVRRVGALMGAVAHPESVWALMRDPLGDDAVSLWNDAGGQVLELDGWLVFPLR